MDDKPRSGIRGSTGTPALKPTTPAHGVKRNMSNKQKYNLDSYITRNIPGSLLEERLENGSKENSFMFMENEVTKKEPTDSDYDTDLENEEHSKTPHDVYGRRTYKRTCRKLSKPQITSVIRDLGTNTVTVRHRSMCELEVLAICNALIDNTTVRVLIIEGNKLSKKSCKYICLGLQENDNIHSISLRNNHIDNESLELLCSRLAHRQILTDFDISDNGFTDAEAKFLAKFIQESKAVERLDLSHNSLSDDGAKILGSAICSNDLLRELDLSWNQFRPQAAIHLSKALEENVRLKSLNLAMNGISTRGAKALAGMLNVNSCLAEIDLTCNRIYDEGAYAIAKMLEKSETVQIVRLSQNPLTNLGALALVTGVSRNPASVMIMLDLQSVHIYKDTLGVYNELKDIRPHFMCVHGHVMDDPIHIASRGLPVPTEDGESPLQLLQWHLAVKKIHLLNVFDKYSEDKNGNISRQDFIEGIKSIKSPLTETQIDDLAQTMDESSSDKVNVRHLLTREFSTLSMTRENTDAQTT